MVRRRDGLNVVRHDPLDPVNLAVDKSGNLLVQSSDGPEGTVYSFRPGSPADQITVLAAAGERCAIRRRGWSCPSTCGTTASSPNQLDLDTYEYTTLAQMFARDVTSAEAEGIRVARRQPRSAGRTRVPAGPGRLVSREWMPTGWRWSNNLDTYGFVTALPGPSECTSRAARRTARTARRCRPDGTLGDLQPFAERGGESVAADSAGHVYVANGQIFVYDKTGKAIGRIDVPERPLQLLFGGPDRRTLFILTHHTLYAVKTREPGEPLPFREVSSHRAAPREEPHQPCDASGPRTRAIAAARRRHRPDCCTSWARPVLVIV